MPVQITCDHCAAVFRVRPSRASFKRFCSASCRTAHGGLRHGHTNKANGHSPTYASWAQMIQRCTNPANSNYDRYGGRGIIVCERWRDFVAFLADMGERPPDLTIDRFPDRNGPYEPGNCRWATKAEQSRNRDVVVLNESAAEEIRRAAANGERQAAIAKRFGVDASHVSRIVSGETWRAA